MMEYTLIRSDRKTLAIEVRRDGEVVVRAPVRMAKCRIEEFVLAKADWIESAKARQFERRRTEPDEKRAGELKAAALAVLPLRVEHFSGIMGVAPTSVKITSAKTRFGSCSGRNGLCFSWRLMEYPQEAIDYVVVHELAHIIQKNHSAAFYREIEKVLPDYKARKALLR